MPSFAHVEHAAFPRLDALAEVAWSPDARRDWPGFLVRLPAQLARYRAQQIPYADSAFAVDIATDRNVALATGRATMTLASRSEEHTSELQSLMRISYAVFCLKKKNNHRQHHTMTKLSNSHENTDT